MKISKLYIFFILFLCTTSIFAQKKLQSKPNKVSQQDIEIVEPIAEYNPFTRVDSVYMIFSVSQVDHRPFFSTDTAEFGAYVKKTLIESGFNEHLGILVHFVVERNGQLADIRIAELGEKFFPSVMPPKFFKIANVISNSPKWHPGIKNGKPVRTNAGVKLYL